MLLKISKKDYFGHLWVLFLNMIFCLYLPSIISYVRGQDASESIVKFSIVLFIITCVPAIVLFIRYLIVSKSIEISYTNDGIEISHNGEIRNIELREIDYVEIKLTLPIYFNGMRYFATDSFLYANVYLKTKESFTVTTLLDNELFNTKHYFSDKVDIVRKLSPICWPPNQKLGFTGN